MKNLLVRGLPDKICREIERMANDENLSLNQVMVRLITLAIEEAGKKREQAKELTQAFVRISEIREAIYRRHGISEDSTKLIREFRDKRNQ